MKLYTFSGPFWPMLTYAGFCWPKPAYAYKCLLMPAFAGLYFPLLVSAGLCWPMLAYATLLHLLFLGIYLFRLLLKAAVAQCSTSRYNYPDFNCCDAVINTTASSSATATMTMTRINRIPPKFPFDRRNRCWMIAFKWPHCPVSVLWRVWQLHFEIMQKQFLPPVTCWQNMSLLWFWNFKLKQTPSITLKTQYSAYTAASIWQSQHDIKNSTFSINNCEYITNSA